MLNYRSLVCNHLCKILPSVFGCLWKLSPLLTNDLGYLRVRQTWVLGYHGCLMMLTVENES
jgi:hypothetical protein